MSTSFGIYISVLISISLQEKAKEVVKEAIVTAMYVTVEQNHSIQISFLSPYAAPYWVVSQQ